MRIILNLKNWIQIKNSLRKTMININNFFRNIFISTVNVFYNLAINYFFIVSTLIRKQTINFQIFHIDQILNCVKKKNTKNI